MRLLLLIALIIAPSLGAATTVAIGGQELRVPEYEGFTRVGPHIPHWDEWAKAVADEGRLALFVVDEAVQGSPGAAEVAINVAANPMFTTRPMTREQFHGYKDLYRSHVSQETTAAQGDPSRLIVPGLTFDDEMTIGHTQCELHPVPASEQSIRACRTSVSVWLGERLLHITAVAHGELAQLNASIVAGEYLSTLRAANEAGRP